MTIHTCPCCNKIFDRRSSFINHTENKKYPCNQRIKPPSESPPDPSTNPPDPIMLSKTKDVSLLNSLNKKDDNDLINIKTSKYSCKYCFKTFVRSDNLKIHVESRCPVRKKEEGTLMNDKDKPASECIELEKLHKGDIIKLLVGQQSQITMLTECIKDLKQNSNQNHTNSHNADNSNSNNNSNNNSIDNSNTQNNTNNGNITTNNIQIEKIEFGKEDLSKLSDNFFINTLMNFYGAEIPKKIIEGIHFNSKFQENMNVYITDLSRNKAMIYDGKVWKVATATELVDDLLDKAVMYCENKHEELQEKIDNNAKQKKKIEKELDIMKFMINYEPDDYDDDGKPMDSDGKVYEHEVFARGKRLNVLAKEYITLTLQNNKKMVVESDKKPKKAAKSRSIKKVE